jgi:hypothetical protein
MQASARKPSQPPVRKHEPVPLLNPTTRAVTAIGAAVLSDQEVRFGVAGNTPLVSPAGSEAGSGGGSKAGSSEASEAEKGEEEGEEEGEELGEEEHEGEEEGEEEEEDPREDVEDTDDVERRATAQRERPTGETQEH